MMGVQAVLHFPVPSVSGQAVLTMPLLVPISDDRRVTTDHRARLQYGAGLTEFVTPTNGAIVVVAAASGVKFGDWLSFAVPSTCCCLCSRRSPSRPPSSASSSRSAS